MPPPQLAPPTPTVSGARLETPSRLHHRTSPALSTGQPSPVVPPHAVIACWAHRVASASLGRVGRRWPRIGLSRRAHSAVSACRAKRTASPRGCGLWAGCWPSHQLTLFYFLYLIKYFQKFIENSKMQNKFSWNAYKYVYPENLTIMLLVTLSFM
jgi:hypothetical protein